MVLLLNSALAVDSIYRPDDWKREADMTPGELARGAAWRRFRDGIDTESTQFGPDRRAGRKRETLSPLKNR